MDQNYLPKIGRLKDTLKLLAVHIWNYTGRWLYGVRGSPQVWPIPSCKFLTNVAAYCRLLQQTSKACSLPVHAGLHRTDMKWVWQKKNTSLQKRLVQYQKCSFFADPFGIEIWVGIIQNASAASPQSCACATQACHRVPPWAPWNHHPHHQGFLLGY
jgi:hypothetical protein